MAKHTPSFLLPVEVDASGQYAQIFGRSFFDKAQRAGVAVRAVCLKQRKTGARRGESPRLLGFDADDLRDLHYLAHAANAYPKLVDELKRIVEDTGAVSAAAILRELGE